MRFFGVLIIALFALHAYAWTAEDLELFTLQKEIIQVTKKPDITFYRYMKLAHADKSTSKEIESNFRKLSKKWHPDKNPKNGKKFENLASIMNVMRDAERKKRYDYYVKNGFPNLNTLKFENRYKPGFGTVLVVVAILFSIVNYVLLIISFKQNKKRLESLKTELTSIYFKTTMNGNPQNIIYYMNKFFLVKSKEENSIWLIDQPFEIDEDYKIDQNGGLTLTNDLFTKLVLKHGNESSELNRRQRRLNLKNAGDLDNLDESMLALIDPEKLEPVGIKDLGLVKLAKNLFKKLLSKKENPETKTKTN